MNDAIKVVRSDDVGALSEVEAYATWLRAKVQRSMAKVATGEARLYSLVEARARLDDIRNRVAHR